MPLNVRRRIGAVVLLVLSCIIGVLAQSTTSADIARDRVKKAKAFVAVKNYNAAIYELEGIRREINDPTVHGVINVMLMNCYLEQGDYKRAQTFLNELYNAQKANKPNASQNYFAVAAQVVKGARSQVERYKSLGLMLNDRNLTPDAVQDIDRMRETIEMVITQTKTISTADKKKSSDVFVLVEESSNARIALARDDFDAKRWKEEVADARENLMTSRSTVLNAVDDGVDPNATVNTTNTVASNTPVQTETQSNPIQNSSSQVTTSPQTVKTETNNQVKFEPVAEQKPATVPEYKPQPETPKETVSNTTTTNNQIANNETAPKTSPVGGGRERFVNNQTTTTTPGAQLVAQNTNEQMNVDGSLLKVGSLVEYATQKVNPVYPAQAKTMRMTGVVKIEVTVDENGQVATVENTSGPSLLQRAATDALKKWKFKPFTGKDGQPIKATGFVSFNFNL